MTRTGLLRYYSATFDKATELRDRDAAAIAATTNGTAVELYPISFQTCAVAVAAASYTGYVAGTAQWTISVEVSDAEAGTYSPIGSAVIPGDGGLFEVPISGFAASQANSEATWMRVVATLTGLAGSLSYGAWVTP